MVGPSSGRSIIKKKKLDDSIEKKSFQYLLVDLKYTAMLAHCYKHIGVFEIKIVQEIHLWS